MPSDSPTPTTLSSSAFIDSIGVNTHIAYTDGEYSSPSLIISDLQYLGVTEVRDGISDGAYGSAPLWHYISIAQAGIKFTFHISNGDTNNAAILNELSEIDQVEEAVPGSVIAIEGVNEINNEPVTFDGISGLAGALAMQAALYADVKADPELSGVAVDYFTGYNAGNVGMGPTIPATPGLADDDTQHPYPNYGEAPAFWVSRAQALPNESAADAPAVYTETGYSSNQVNEYVQEVYTLDLLMDTAQEGISHTDLYDLLDAYAPGSPQGDDGYGLFANSEAPKPVATGIHDLTSILGQIPSGTEMPSAGIGYTLSNLPSDGNSMELTEGNAADVIVVWAEPQIWNDSTGNQVAAPTEQVTIALDAYYADVDVYDPMAGTAAIATYTDTDSITVAVTEHPILVEVSGGDPPPPTGAATCFCAGTRIRAANGEIEVEKLQAGDLVATLAGMKPIKWIGKRFYSGREIAGNHLMLPICIKKDAIAAEIPSRDLWVSPGHGICIDDVLVPAWRLVNGISIVQAEAVRSVRYYHIEFEAHEILLAENCAAESFIDDGCRNIFHNAESYTSEFGPERHFVARCRRRVEEGFHLLSIQRRLKLRAGAEQTLAACGDLRGYVDIAGPQKIAGWAQNVEDPEQPVCLDILVDGAYVTHVLANRYRADLRQAGLGSGAHAFELELPVTLHGQVEIRRSADQARLTAAAHAA